MSIAAAATAVFTDFAAVAVELVEDPSGCGGCCGRDLGNEHAVPRPPLTARRHGAPRGCAAAAVAGGSGKGGFSGFDWILPPCPCGGRRTRGTCVESRLTGPAWPSSA